MAPGTRSHTGSRRAAAKSAPGDGKKGRSQKGSQKPKVPCPICTKLQGEGAGLARHMRSAHPSPAAVADPPEQPEVGRLIPSPPANVGGRALTLWRLIVNEFDLRADELRILEDACREAMLIDRLDSELEGANLIVKGSMGQPTASPLLTEVRQHRATLAGLFAKLKLADDNVSGDSAAERRIKARAAANARWRRGP